MVAVAVRASRPVLGEASMMRCAVFSNDWQALAVVDLGPRNLQFLVRGDVVEIDLVGPDHRQYRRVALHAKKIASPVGERYVLIAENQADADLISQHPLRIRAG